MAGFKKVILNLSNFFPIFTLKSKTTLGQNTLRVNLADIAAKNFALPESLGDWQYFREGFHEIALNAWYRELDAH